MTSRLNFLIINFFLFSCLGFAQPGKEFDIPPSLPDFRIVEIADSLFPNLKGSFKWVNSTQSPLGMHHTFIQTWQTIPIFKTYLILHVNAHKKLYHHQHLFFEGKFPNDSLVTQNGFMWFISDQTLIKTQFITWKNNKQKPWFIIFNQADTLARFPMFLPYKDSMVKAKVFLPNPITSSHGKYGSYLLDMNDANNPVLESELKWVKVKARFDSGYFYLQNDFVTLEEISQPYYNTTSVSTPEFYFNRSQYQFEDINAFYHLSSQIEYLQKLGFGKLIPFIKIDTHALQGADQSLFKFSSQPYTIEYGTGGVDDAEDAEVVVHEYGHALSQAASPNSTLSGSAERLAMEEGWADYLAVSHFKSLDRYNWEMVFDWDGHNEFWEGINTNSSKKYPEDLTNQRDEDREIWSTPLLCMSDKLGKAKADSLLLQLLYFQTHDATMPQMAEKLIYIDTLLFYGDNYHTIKECFIETGILTKDHRDLFQGELGETTDYRIINSSGFASHNGPLGIKFNRKVDCIFSVYDIHGQLILQQTHNRSDFIVLEQELLKSGIYILHIEPQANARGYRNFYVREKVVKW